MWIDPIVAELHQIREDHAKLFAYDMDAIFADLKRQEQESNRTYITLSVKRCITECTTPAPG